MEDTANYWSKEIVKKMYSLSEMAKMHYIYSLMDENALKIRELSFREVF